MSDFLLIGLQSKYFSTFLQRKIIDGSFYGNSLKLQNYKLCSPVRLTARVSVIGRNRIQLNIAFGLHTL